MMPPTSSEQSLAKDIAAGSHDSNNSKPAGWVGVDLDGTLAKYEGWRGVEHVGEPVPAMLLRVRRWLVRGIDVRIFTARVGPQRDVNETIRAREAIERWCVEHFGQALPITATKDFAMRELWDDRCVQVEPNTGRRMDGVDDLR